MSEPRVCIRIANYSLDKHRYSDVVHTIAVHFADDHYTRTVTETVYGNCLGRSVLEGAIEAACETLFDEIKKKGECIFESPSGEQLSFDGSSVEYADEFEHNVVGVEIISIEARKARKK